MKRTLLNVLKSEMQNNVKGGIYHKLQIAMTFNSNYMEGSCLSYDQTKCIFETDTINFDTKASNPLRVNDIIETVNHFRAIDFVISHAESCLSEDFIKTLHKMLKSGTTDTKQKWFALGEYKKLPNKVGGRATTPPKEVPFQMCELLANYETNENYDLDDLLDFHVKFELLHPFQDGNGRVGRLVLLKECLHHDIVPFIIDDVLKMYYYRGLAEWSNTRGCLRDACLTAQDKFCEYLDYFQIEYRRDKNGC